MKKIFFIMFALFIMSFPAYADTVNGVDFIIPSEWTLAKADEGDIAINYYTLNDDIIMIGVQNIPTELDEEARNIISNIYLMNCDDIYSEKEGYYLMRNDQAEADGLKTIVQECVYFEDDNWNHIFLGSRNYGDYSVSIIYLSPTLSIHEAFPDVCNLLLDHIYNE